MELLTMPLRLGIRKDFTFYFAYLIVIGRHEPASQQIPAKTFFGVERQPSV